MKRVLTLAAIILVSSCTKYSPAAPNAIDKLVTLTTDQSSIPADGVSSVKLTLSIPAAQLDIDRPTVTFTATDGIFTSGVLATNPHQASVTLTGDGTANTALIASTTVHSVDVDASVTLESQVIRMVKTINFTAPTAASVFTFVALPSSIPANGFALVHLTAQLQFAGGDMSHRMVHFTSSNGMQLFAAGLPPGPSQDVVAGLDGTAEADAQSTKTVGSFEVTATVNGVIQRVPIIQTPVDPASVISLTLPLFIVADNRTQNDIVATVASNLPDGRRTVTFTVSPSSIVLTPTSAVADSSSHVHAFLTSPSQTGTVGITATVDNTSAVGTISIVPAPPQSLSVAIAKPTVSVSGNDSVHVTVSLQRDVGTTTAGTAVSIVARTASGAQVGSFVGSLLSTADGTVGVDFFPGSGPAGPATITASVGSVSGTAQLVITP